MQAVRTRVLVSLAGLGALCLPPTALQAQSIPTAQERPQEPEVNAAAPGDSQSRLTLKLKDRDLRDIVVVVSRSPKAISSSEGHRIASRHPFMAARQQDLAARIVAVKGAIANRDFATFGALVEHEAMEVQAIMMSGQPSALYLQGSTVALIHRLREWREHDGLAVWFTLDAGPNLHVLCEGKDAAEVKRRLAAVAPKAELLENRPGPGARLHDDHLF